MAFRSERNGGERDDVASGVLRSLCPRQPDAACSAQSHNNMSHAVLQSGAQRHADACRVACVRASKRRQPPVRGAVFEFARAQGQFRIRDNPNRRYYRQHAMCHCASEKYENAWPESGKRDKFGATHLGYPVTLFGLAIGFTKPPFDRFGSFYPCYPGKHACIEYNIVIELGCMERDGMETPALQHISL